MVIGLGCRSSRNLSWATSHESIRGMQTPGKKPRKKLPMASSTRIKIALGLFLAQSVGSLRRSHTSGVWGEADMPTSLKRRD